ncbi:4-phosphoerythronate dehydrogenase [Legionella londiniensis]|uniref:Erythronate-4-phosphate dehydrogenase n=1 Tax=Legionella londiniensis TaxID=45068 RepID=A0A0W0VMS8_9GAMM|nr:4-phosphoerythronate dehydrogenase [Legionella londiniensis]KTD21372.1 erythronate-4-phosphate dehydrogenase [Legionella londiniensis]STX93571.1 erythronate-4-phosphate dehydrogenase [Legionella londiniensis]
MIVLADASLPELGPLFPKPLILERYKNEDELKSLLPKADVLLCRSTLKVTADLIDGSSLQAVATASSGIDHIDSNYLKKNGIALFNAHGSNAVAVADYVVSSIAHLDKAKKLTGRKAGIIGAGKVGSEVAKRLRTLGFKVLRFDPIKAEENPKETYYPKEALFSCDLLCIHANLHDTKPYPSRNLIDADFLAKIKPGAAIINAARGSIVHEEALLQSKTPITYCTDVYTGEPQVDERIVEFAEICTPHIAGHSIEAKIAAVVQTSAQIHQFFGLSAPEFKHQESPKQPKALAQHSWQDFILNLYNPTIETAALKNAGNKKDAFLALRPAHNARHDFSFFDAPEMNQQFKKLIGVM